jgi:hypothetical protein
VIRLYKPPLLGGKRGKKRKRSKKEREQKNKKKMEETVRGEDSADNRGT